MLQIPNPIDPAALVKVLTFLHGKALTGMPSQLSAAELAQRYASLQIPLAARADHLIKGQVAASASVGFSTGLGGLLTLPISLPANLASNYYLHLRMASAIAVLCGYDPAQDQVRALSLICLLGGDAKETLERIGIQYFVLTKDEAMDKINAEVQGRIADVVAKRILAKLGTKGAVMVGRSIPLLGGVVSGGVDALYSYKIGQTAKSIFLRSPV